MAYATISTWKLNEPLKDEDVLWRTMQDKYVPMSKALGAVQVLVINIAEGESAIVSVYPDQAARDAAEAKIAELRKTAGSEFNATMTGEMRGEVRAQSD
jgi:hypothetical protein